MNSFLKLSLLSLLACTLFGLTSCSEDDVVDTQNFQGELAEGDRSGRQGPRGVRGGKCFELVFPITVSFEDGSTVTAEDKETLREAIQTWRENNPDATEKPSFVFPIEVTQDDTTITVASAEDFEVLKEACPRGRGGKGRRGGRHGGGFAKCLDVVYPITIVFADGTTQEVDSREAQREAVQAWKEANPDATERPAVQFPIEVVTEEGETVSVADQDALKELAKECRSQRRHRAKCFDLVYPVTMELPDGTQITGDSRQDIREALRTYVEANGRPDERPELVYPVTIEYEDGTQVTVNSKEELKELKDACDTDD